MFIYHSSNGDRGVVACFLIEETNSSVAEAMANRMREAMDKARSEGVRAAVSGCSPAQCITLTHCRDVCRWLGVWGLQLSGEAMENRASAAAGLVEGATAAVTARARVWLINPFARDRGIPKFGPLFAKMNTNADASCSFTPRVVRDAGAAWSALSGHLARYRTARSAPTIVLIQSRLSKSAMLHLVPALDQFPLVMVPGHPGDDAYPAMGWKQMVAQAVVARYIGMHQWWAHRLDACRYAHIPVGNLGSDFESSMADVFFARTLQHNKHVLWMSPSHQADTGGGDDDSGVLALHSNLGTTGKQSLVGAGEPSNPVIRRPGAYRNVCIELELSHLAVSTVVMSHHLDDIEGVAGSALSALPDASMDDFAGNGRNAAAGLLPKSLDETTACASAFKMLKVGAGVGCGVCVCRSWWDKGGVL